MSDNDYNNLEKLILTTLAIVSIMVLALLMSGCKQTEYVYVPEVHEIHHHHTDSIKEKDSTYHEKETVVMQLDSEAMAQYGIQLKAAERAWLVRTAELERQLQQLSEHHTDTVHEIDSIPVPHPVPQYIEKELTWWQRTKMKAGVAFICILCGAALFGLYKLLKRFGIINF